MAGDAPQLRDESLYMLFTLFTSMTSATPPVISNHQHYTANEKLSQWIAKT